MPLSVPIKLSEQSAHIGRRLLDWVSPRGGTVEVLPTMAKLWERAYGALDKPLVLVCFERERIRGPFSEQDYWHRVDRQWVVVVIRVKGFLDINGEARANQASFYDDVESIRDQIRTILSVSEEFPLNYTGMESLLVQARPGLAQTFLDGYALRFTTANDIPDILEEQIGS